MTFPIGVTFPNRLGGGAQRAKSAQATIKNLIESDFLFKIDPFLTDIGGLSPSLWGGGARAPPKEM